MTELPNTNDTIYLHYLHIDPLHVLCYIHACVYVGLTVMWLPTDDAEDIDYRRYNYLIYNKHSDYIELQKKNKNIEHIKTNYSFLDTITSSSYFSASTNLAYHWFLKIYWKCREHYKLNN